MLKHKKKKSRLKWGVISIPIVIMVLFLLIDISLFPGKLRVFSHVLFNYGLGNFIIDESYAGFTTQTDSVHFMNISEFDFNIIYMYGELYEDTYIENYLGRKISKHMEENWLKDNARNNYYLICEAWYKGEKSWRNAQYDDIMKYIQESKNGPVYMLYVFDDSMKSLSDYDWIYEFYKYVYSFDAQFMLYINIYEESGYDYVKNRGSYSIKGSNGPIVYYTSNFYSATGTAENPPILPDPDINFLSKEQFFSYFETIIYDENGRMIGKSKPE